MDRAVATRFFRVEDSAQVVVADPETVGDRG